MTSRKMCVLSATLALGLTACSATDGEDPELSDEFRGGPSGETIVRWNDNNFTILTTLDSGAPSGLLLIRELAMVHLAMHDALNAADRKYEGYVFDGDDDDADAALSAAAGARSTLIALRPGKTAQIESLFQVDLNRVSDPNKRQRSIDLGQGAADAIVAARANDGFFAVVPYTFRPPAPGVWQPVPPAGTNAVGTQLRFVTPFGMTSGSQFRPPPPPALSSPTWRTNYNETKNFGKSDSTVRTADQTNAALFWREQTQFAWNRIARTVATARDKGLHDTARAFALANVGLIDGLISNFDAKYHYEYWRPYTAIREVDDGRADTVMDPTWEPLNPTPGHPEHNSAQGLLGAAAAFPLKRLWGNNTPFTITTSTAVPAGSTRSYNSFDHAVIESADSRIWGGIHFRSATGASAQNQGKQISDFVEDRILERADDDDDDD